MRRPTSLTLRLTLFFGITAAIVLLVFGWIVGRSIEHHFEEHDVDELKVLSRIVLRSLSVIHSAEDLVPLKRRLAEIVAAHRGMSLYIATQDRRTIFASQGANLAAIALTMTPAQNIDHSSPFVWKDAQQTYRGSAFYGCGHNNDRLPPSISGRFPPDIVAYDHKCHRDHKPHIRSWVSDHYKPSYLILSLSAKLIPTHHLTAEGHRPSSLYAEQPLP